MVESLDLGVAVFLPNGEFILVMSIDVRYILAPAYEHREYRSYSIIMFV